MKRGIAVFLLLTFPTACAVGPKYQRPKAALPDSFRGQEGRASGDEGQISFGDLPWWEVFEDKELQELIRKALEQNKDLKIAAARIEEARGLYRMKRGDQFPQLGFATSGSQTFTNKDNVSDEGNLGNITRTYVAVGIDLSYEADLWGRYRRASEAARAELFAQEEFRRMVLITLLSDVARAYFELRSLDLELAIAKSTTAVRGRSLDLTRIRLRGGVVSLLDVRQAEAEVAISATQIPRIEREIGLKENEISLLLGENPHSVPRGQSLAKQSMPPDLPLNLPSALLERRPDIRSAEQQLIAANARIGEAKALFFPQINLSNIVGMAFVTGAFGGVTGVASLGGSLFQFLFDGGKRKGNLHATKARFEQALLNYEKVIQQSLREVSDSLISIKKLAEMRKEQEKLVRAARDGLRLANARYEGGISSYLEVLDAQRILFRSELELVAIKREQWVAVVQLYRSLGGGWEQSEAQAPEVATGGEIPSKKE
jgi:multidrug efflux system outer membrane protein